MNTPWWENLNTVQQLRLEDIVKLSGLAPVHDWKSCPECRDYVLHGDS